MSTKVKRKVTVENSKESDEPRRPSVFERLGPGAGNVAPPPAERHSRTAEHNEKCRNWLRTGECTYGSACRYTHKAFSSTSRRSAKSEKEMEVKDLRHKVKTKREEPKESRKDSTSPKPRKSSKRSRSRSRKGDHEGKIKSTVVVTRPRSPGAEATESKKKPENWEDDSDDWPMDAAQLDYKEELTLERKRQQLQRELELELQKEQLLNEGVTITKTVSFSESSSTSSSSDSGSLSSSSESSTSSSEGDSNETSSSTSSSSSSSSRPPIKKKNKKSQLKELSRSLKSKSKDDYEKTKRSAKSKKARSPSPALESRKASRKAKDKIRERNMSPPVSKKRHSDGRGEGKNSNVRVKGPRTPSPIPKSRKQRQWAQSSSADSRTADLQRSKGKRHKKKKDTPRSEKRKTERMLSPPPLSSPNRLALLPVPSKKSKSRDESGSKSRRRHRESSPMLLPRASSANLPPVKMLTSSRYITDEKPIDKMRSDDRGRLHPKRETEELLSLHKRTDSHERATKRSRVSPRKELRKASLSPPPLKERYDSEAINRKLYAVAHEKEKMDRRRLSVSPIRSDRRKMGLEMEKKRDIRDSPSREHDSRGLYRGSETHGYDKRGIEAKVKRFVSPEIKKGREDKGRDHVKDRGVDYDVPSWQGDHRKPGSSSSGRRTPEPRGRQEMRSQAPLLRSDRSRERDSDRKKSGKKRDLSIRPIDDPDRARLPSPRRSESPLLAHHAVREIESLTGTRTRMYESDLPPTDREYAYGYDSLHDPFLSERLLPPDYESDVLRGPPVYPSEVYSESRYRRGPKDPLDRYEPRDISPREVMPHRDIISLTGRGDDYLPDLPIDERSYDDRWPRGRARDDWDTYSSIPPAALPPHVTAALGEDRYGMPRRRRASPEWPRSRIEDRETAINPSHRPVGRGPPPPREGRSRSPGAKPTAANRNSWNDRSGRRDRSIESRQHEDAPKNLDDRKGRPPIKKDKIKPKSESSVEDKTPTSIKEKAPVKRPHSPSPSPQVKAKKRRNDIQAFDILKYHGASENSDKKASPALPKKAKEDPKSGSKVASSSTRTLKSADAVKKESESKASIDSKISTSSKEKAPVKRNSSSPAPASKVNKNKRNDSQALDVLKYQCSNSNSKKADAVKKENESKASEDGKISTSSKERAPVKRNSSSPAPPNKVNKTRRNDIQALDVLKYHGCNTDSKKGKQETPPPKSEPLSTTEKSDTPSKNSGDNKAKDKDNRKTRKTDDNTRGEDDFSDWSDDDDDLLTRDDFTDTVGSTEKGRHKADESLEGNSRRREKHSSKESQDFRRDKESSGGRDKDRSNEEALHSKDSKSVLDAKETDTQESLSVKEDTATDVDEYITAESVDYDPISDDELDALIEEPDEILMKPTIENEKSKIVDALDVNWSAIMSETKTEFVPGFARQRFKAAHVLSRIGFSQALAGSELSEKIISLCQKQLDEEDEDEAVKEEGPKEEKKFVMEHELAAFHVSISQNKRERDNLFSKVGPYRRALCARRDLQIRKILSKPLNKLAAVPTVSFPPQYTVVDKDLYKQSLELLKLKKTPEVPVDSSVTPSTVDVC